MEDTVLDGKRWLEKGSILKIPNKIIHNYLEMWDANAKEYTPKEVYIRERNTDWEVCVVNVVGFFGVGYSTDVVS